MKHIIYIVSAIFLLQSNLIAQTTQLNNIAAVLFLNVKTKLTVQEKNKIASLSGFVLSGKKDEPFAQDKESKEYPFMSFVYPTDLNKDGTEEIFIIFGNTYTSGNTGSNVVLYIKSATGNYISHLGFPGTAPDILTTANMGYPDLLIGGPGFEFPVFRWNGKTYDNYRTVKDKDMEKLKRTSLEDLSKTYQQGIK
jgi:hypothetical protein